MSVEGCASYSSSNELVSQSLRVLFSCGALLHVQDIAKLTMACLRNPATERKTLTFAGPRSWTSQEVPNDASPAGSPKRREKKENKEKKKKKSCFCACLLGVLSADHPGAALLCVRGLQAGWMQQWMKVTVLRCNSLLFCVCR